MKDFQIPSLENEPVIKGLTVKIKDLINVIIAFINNLIKFEF